MYFMNAPHNKGSYEPTQCCEKSKQKQKNMQIYISLNDNNNLAGGLFVLNMKKKINRFGRIEFWKMRNF